jgi:methionyl-tRNA synthetase
MQKKEPWIVVRTLEETPDNQQLIDNCLHLCLQVTANLAILINPFLPFTARKMLHLMKVVEKMLDWENAGKLKLLSVGYSLRAPELLFRKIEDAEVKEQIGKLQAASAARVVDEVAQEAAVTPDKEIAVKPAIGYDDFAKLDLRVGTIVTAEKVEKADKLLKLGIDLGSEQRTIVSGIALHFKPEEIIGRQVVVVANLSPRKMRGIESNGMILMAEDPSGKLYFVQPGEKIQPGSGVS